MGNAGCKPYIDNCCDGCHPPPPPPPPKPVVPPTMGLCLAPCPTMSWNKGVTKPQLLAPSGKTLKLKKWYGKDYGYANCQMNCTTPPNQPWSVKTIWEGAKWDGCSYYNDAYCSNPSVGCTAASRAPIGGGATYTRDACAYPSIPSTVCAPAPTYTAPCAAPYSMAPAPTYTAPPCYSSASASVCSAYPAAPTYTAPYLPSAPISYSAPTYTAPISYSAPTCSYSALPAYTSPYYSAAAPLSSVCSSVYSPPAISLGAPALPAYTGYSRTYDSYSLLGTGSPYSCSGLYF